TTTATDSDTTTTAPSPTGPIVIQAVGVTIEPSTDLLDGDLLTVSITGMTPWAQVSATQCPVGAVHSWNGCDPVSEAYAQADASGAVTLRIRAKARISLDWSGTEQVDCRTGDGCIVAITSDGENMVAQLPLPFDPDGPLAPAPVAQVSPTGLLDHGEVVDLT